MVKDGIYYGIGFGFAGLLIGGLFSQLWALPLFGLAFFCMYFFRDPEREIPDGAVAVSPADGKVQHIRDLEDGGKRVSIFLNVFNVHVNRVPVGGKITAADYNKGTFVMAHKEDASEENERNKLLIEPADQRSGPIAVTQIAGLVARRIVCDKRPGDEVEKGERFGLIKFGSRTDVHFGPEWELAVQIGEKVAGGSSILARLREGG